MAKKKRTFPLLLLGMGIGLFIVVLGQTEFGVDVSGSFQTFEILQIQTDPVTGEEIKFQKGTFIDRILNTPERIETVYNQIADSLITQYRSRDETGREVKISLNADPDTTKELIASATSEAESTILE